MRVSSALSAHIEIGDEIAFPIPLGDEIGGEVYITKEALSSGHSHDLYQAPIGYVSHPKLDKRGQHFVSADVQESRLGISTIFLPCEALRDYFYRLRGAAGQNNRQNLYEALLIPASASPAELRVAYRLRALEVAGNRSDEAALARAFNILGQPELRACYDALRARSRSPGDISLRRIWLTAREWRTFA